MEPIAPHTRPVPHWPALLAPTPGGLGLIADGDLPAGAPVARYEGPVVGPFEQVPEAEVRYALLIAPDTWLVPLSSARYVNHACSPNCTVDDALTVITARPVAAGEELTIAYNHATFDEPLPPWDPRWSFDCACGSPACQGRVDDWRRDPT